MSQTNLFCEFNFLFSESKCLAGDQPYYPKNQYSFKEDVIKRDLTKRTKKTFSILHKAYVTIVVKTKLQVLLSKLKIIKMAPSATDLCIIFKDLNSFSKVNRKIRKLTKRVGRFCRTFWSTLLLFNPRHFGFILDTPRHEKDWRLRHGIPK